MAKRITEEELAALYEKAFDAKSRLDPSEEKLMLKKPQWAYLYARYILKDRWPAKEEKIFYKDTKYAYLYSCFVGSSVSEDIERFMISEGLQNQDDSFVKKFFDDDYCPASIRELVNKELVEK